MKRLLAVAASVAIAAGASLAASTAANAKPAIRTYTEQGTITFRGTGPDKGFLSQAAGSESVILAPRLALRSTTKTVLALSTTGVQRDTVRFDIVGGRNYTRVDSASWQIKALSPASLRKYQRQLDPAVALREFFALRGVRRLSATHYSVTGAFAAIEPFLAAEYDLTSKNFSGSGVKTLTVSVWTNNNGWLTKITVAGQSGTLSFSAIETFGNYNKPLTIAAP